MLATLPAGRLRFPPQASRSGCARSTIVCSWSVTRVVREAGRVSGAGSLFPPDRTGARVPAPVAARRETPRRQAAAEGSTYRGSASPIAHNARGTRFADGSLRLCLERRKHPDRVDSSKEFYFSRSVGASRAPRAMTSLLACLLRQQRWRRQGRARTFMHLERGRP